MEPKIAELRAQGPVKDIKQDPPAETLGLVREMAARMSSDSVRGEKALAMLHVIFAKVMGSAAPPLDPLRGMVRTLQEEAMLKGLTDLTWMSPQTPMPQRTQHRQQPSMTGDPMTIPRKVTIPGSESEK